MYFTLIQYLSSLEQHSKRNWAPVSFSSEVYVLSFGQELALSHIENYQVFL